ncbi:MAG: hypothetical protein PHI08_06580 [Bacteroidales bacterium]|nr:hypothetical protein [Bacteroidales bacterium]
MKKYILKFFPFAASLSLLITGCSLSNDYFKGTDNYVTKFQIISGTNTYPAEIKEDSINIYVPENASVDGAKAAYIISEHSDISPDPTAVTQWSREQKFVVTSYEGKERTYYCNVFRTAAVSEGNVSLLTQEQADEFAKSGVTKISGNLTVGAIDNTSALNSITDVYKNITFTKDYKLKAIDGFTNLVTAGNIYIGTESTAFAPDSSVTVSFPALNGTGAVVINSSKVTEVSMPKLQSVYSLVVNASKLINLNIDALVSVLSDVKFKSGAMDELSLPKLSSVVGDFSAGGLNSTKVNLSSLSDVGGILSFQLAAVKELSLPVLKKVGINISLSNMAALESLKFNALSSVDGTLSLDGLGELSDVDISAIKSVGTLYINNCGKMQSVCCPTLLTAKIVDLERLAVESISFSSLESVTVQFKMQKMSMLQKLELPKLTYCAKMQVYYFDVADALDFSPIGQLGSLEVIAAYKLASLTLPETLQKLTLNGASRNIMPVLKNVKTINVLNISQFKGDINIASVEKIIRFSDDGNSGMTGLEFSDAKEIDTLNFGSYRVTSLKAPKLTKIMFLDMSDPDALNDIQMPLLKEISGEMKIWGATYEDGASQCEMTNLNAFSSVTKIGSVNIKWCGHLSDFSGLKNAIGSLTDGTWAVSGCSYNPSFADMQAGKFKK